MTFLSWIVVCVEYSTVREIRRALEEQYHNILVLVSVMCDKTSIVQTKNWLVKLTHMNIVYIMTADVLSLVAPGHKQKWTWIWRTNRSSTRKDYKKMCRLNVEELSKHIDMSGFVCYHLERQCFYVFLLCCTATNGIKVEMDIYICHGPLIYIFKCTFMFTHGN